MVAPTERDPVSSGADRLAPRTRHAWKNGAIALILATLMIAVWFAGEVLVVVFGGLIVAAYFSGLAMLLTRHSRLSYGPALGIVLGLHAVAALAFGPVAYTVAAPQVKTLSTELPRAASDLRDQLAATEWGSAILAHVPSALEAGPSLTSGEWLGRVTGAVSGVLGFFANGALLLFVGIYVAVNPALYEKGALSLVPPGRRRRMREVLHRVAHTLRMWLVGRIVAGVVIGVGSTLILWALGVPLPGLLGILAGILNFVPNVGPIVAAILPAMLALGDDVRTAGWVVVAYVGLQFVESYLLTPYVEKRAVAVPPALLLAAQILLGLAFGVVGLAFAAPLLAVTMVLVRMLYVEDVLGERDASPDAPANA